MNFSKISIFMCENGDLIVTRCSLIDREKKEKREGGGV